MNDSEIILATLMFLIIILLTYNLALFIKIRYDIAEINKKQIESCVVLDCSIDFFGNIECVTQPVPQIFNDNLTLIKINVSDYEP